MSVQNHHENNSRFDLSQLLRIKQLKNAEGDREYLSLEATVIELFESESESIRQVGLLRDPTGIIKFISWEASDCSPVSEGETYIFKNISVNSNNSSDDLEVVCRSKTEITHQYSDTREQFLKSIVPKDQNKNIDRSEWTVSLTELLSTTPYRTNVYEPDLDSAVAEGDVPWETEFITQFNDTHPNSIQTKTRIAEYSQDSVRIERKYSFPYPVVNLGVEFYNKVNRFLSSEYLDHTQNGLYNSYILARTAECTDCEEIFEIAPYLDIHPIEDADGQYVNWWYGGNGTETNEDFRMVSCPFCGVDPTWYEEHQYGSGVLFPKKIAKSAVFEFEISFDPVETIEELIKSVSNNISDSFTVQYTPSSILSMKCDKLNDKAGEELIEIEKSGDPGKRGYTRQYLKYRNSGIALKDDLDRIQELYETENETICRVQEYPATNQSSVTTEVNSYYYPVRRSNW